MNNIDDDITFYIGGYSTPDAYYPNYSQLIPARQTVEGLETENYDAYTLWFTKKAPYGESTICYPLTYHYKNHVISGIGKTLPSFEPITGKKYRITINYESFSIDCGLDSIFSNKHYTADPDSFDEFCTLYVTNEKEQRIKIQYSYGADAGQDRPFYSSKSIWPNLEDVSCLVPAIANINLRVVTDDGWKSDAVSSVTLQENEEFLFRVEKDGFAILESLNGPVESLVYTFTDPNPADAFLYIPIKDKTHPFLRNSIAIVNGNLTINYPKNRSFEFIFKVISLGEQPLKNVRLKSIDFYDTSGNLVECDLDIEFYGGIIYVMCI